MTDETKETPAPTQDEAITQAVDGMLAELNTGPGQLTLPDGYVFETTQPLAEEITNKILRPMVRGMVIETLIGQQTEQDLRRAFAGLSLAKLALTLAKCQIEDLTARIQQLEATPEPTPAPDDSDPETAVG